MKEYRLTDLKFVRGHRSLCFTTPNEPMATAESFRGIWSGMEALLLIRKLLKVLGDGVVRDVRIVEGVE